MAHPSRAELVERKAEALPEAAVIWDRGRGEWDTGRRALSPYEPVADYHAVIQDDAILPPDLPALLELVSTHAESAPIGLYVGQVRPQARLMAKAVRRAHESGIAWLEMAGGPIWGVGVALPVASLPRMIREADQYTHPLYDARLKEAYRTLGSWARYPIPSLLDHDPLEPSLIDSAGGDRRAYDFIGKRDPRGFAWDGPRIRIDQRGRLL